MMDLSGKLLVAMPGLGDPRFERSVILVCAHSQNGAMGLIVNKPAPDLALTDLLDQLGIARVRGDGRGIHVHFGGPVERGRGFVLHSADYAGSPATMRIASGYRMTATLDILEAMAQGQGPASALLALGYAGWGPRQLEEEIARNDWLTADAPADLVFSPDNPAKWLGALRHMGIDALTLSPLSGRA